MLRFRALGLLAFLLLGVGFASTLAQGIDVPLSSFVGGYDSDLLTNEKKLCLPAENSEEVTKVAVNKNNEISFKAEFPKGCDLGKVPSDDLKFNFKYGVCEVSLGWDNSAFKFNGNTILHGNKTVDVSIKGSGFTLAISEHVQMSGDTKCSKFGDNLETNEKGEYAVEVSATKSKQCNLKLEILNSIFVPTMTTLAPEEMTTETSKGAFVGSGGFWGIVIGGFILFIAVVVAIGIVIWCCYCRRRNPDAKKEPGLQSVVTRKNGGVAKSAKAKPANPQPDDLPPLELVTCKSFTLSQNVNAPIDKPMERKIVPRVLTQPLSPRILQGKMAESWEYPTMADVKSDWGPTIDRSKAKDDKKDPKLAKDSIEQKDSIKPKELKVGELKSVHKSGAKEPKKIEKKQQSSKEQDETLKKAETTSSMLEVKPTQEGSGSGSEGSSESQK